MSQAKKICQARNVRLTPQREEVLRLIAAQPCAISAYDLLDLLRISEPQAKPPTIYRGLEFLLEQGFIHKIESTNSYVICHHFEDPKHTSVMLICDSCGSVAESNGQTVETAIIKLAKRLVSSYPIPLLKAMDYARLATKSRKIVLKLCITRVK